MFFNISKMNFMLLLIFSTLLSISSNSWIGCWIGLEINLLSFIPLISNSKNLMTSEASLKYFLTQSIASMNLLFFIILSMMNLFMLNKIMEMLINSTLLLKMGSAPFHFWFPNMVEGMSWMNCFILMTWQKITPMILLSYYYNYDFLISISIISLIIGSIGGLNQTSLRKLLAFSSINHISWLILAMLISINLWNFYFCIYSIMMLTMCLMFQIFNTFYLNQLFFLKLNNLMKTLLLLNLISLGGLPPFLGFLPKWIIINKLIEYKMNMLMFIMIMFTLITLFYYIQISYSSFMMAHKKMKWMLFTSKNKLMNYVIYFSMILSMSLIFSTFIYNFI